MARNPLSIQRAPNLAALAAGFTPGARGGPKLGDGLKDFKREMQQLAAQAMNRAVEAEIAKVEGQSRSFKPTHAFLRGKRLTTANLLQNVSIAFDHRPEIVQAMLRGLTKTKPPVPIDSGDYAANFKLFINGTEGTPGQIKYGVRCEIVNTSDYARMLEVGFGEDGKPFVQQVLPGIVERIAVHAAKSTWRTQAKFKYTFTDIPNPYILKTNFHMGRGTRPGRTRRDRQAGMPINYPTIVIDL